MGLFDTITCKAKLPDKGLENEIFQTKSLDCQMDGYEITADVRLFKTPFGDRLPVAGEWVAFHGDIVFYTELRLGGQNQKRRWCEYIARFTNGKLESITRHPNHWSEQH